MVCWSSFGSVTNCSVICTMAKIHECKRLYYCVRLKKNLYLTWEGNALFHDFIMLLSVNISPTDSSVGNGGHCRTLTNTGGKKCDTKINKNSDARLKFPPGSDLVSSWTVQIKSTYSKYPTDIHSRRIVNWQPSVPWTPQNELFIVLFPSPGQRYVFRSLLRVHCLGKHKEGISD